MQRHCFCIIAITFFATTTSMVFAAEEVTVISVIDGDTVKVRIGSTVESVRVIGVDAPELRGTAREKCFGKEAGAKMEELLRKKSVTLSFNPAEDRDVYGRLLRYVFAGQRDAGAILIGLGYARSYRFFPHPRRALYNRLEARAKAGRRGLWSACMEK